MSSTNIYRCPKSHATGTRGAPVRFTVNDSESYDPSFIEIYPQNSWKDLSENTLLIQGYNNHDNDRDECDERVVEHLGKSDENSVDCDWLGVENAREYKALLRAGDLNNNVKLSAELGQAIQNLAPKDKKRRKKWINNFDGDIMFDAYTSRDPEIFYAKRLVDGKKFKTNLVIATGGNCNVNAKTLTIRAQVYAKIIDELGRQGHNLGVWACDPIRYSGATAFILWEIKRHNEQLSLPILQRDLGHPAVYRTGVFDLIASLPKCPGSGLGQTATENFHEDDYPRRRLSEIIKLEIGEPTVVLNLFDLNKNTTEESVHKVLPSIAKELNSLVTEPKLSGVHYINHKTE